MRDPFVEHWNRRVLRHEVDPDIAAMLLADYAARLQQSASKRNRARVGWRASVAPRR